MAQFNMHEAKTRLSELVQMAERGEEVIIARDGKPAVKLVEVKPAEVPAEPRKRGGLGIWEGKVWISPDFDEPDEELIESFYNSELFPPDDPTVPRGVIINPGKAE